MSGQSKKILKTYSVAEAQAALKHPDAGFIRQEDSGDGVFQLWVHPTYKEFDEKGNETGFLTARFRTEGQLDENSRGRLEKLLREARRRNEEAAIALTEKKPLENRPAGLSETVDAFEDGGFVTLSDRQAPYFSLRFRNETDAATLRNATALGDMSAPVRQTLKEAEEKFNIRVIRQQDDVRIVQPDLLEAGKSFAASDPEYIGKFSLGLKEAMEEAQRVAEDRFFKLTSGLDEKNVPYKIVKAPPESYESHETQTWPITIPVYGTEGVVPQHVINDLEKLLAPRKRASEAEGLHTSRTVRPPENYTARAVQLPSSGGVFKA